MIPLDRFPASVPFRDVVAFIHSFAPNVDIDDIRSVEIAGGSVTLVLVRRDEQGRLMAAGCEIATVTVVYPLDRDDEVTPAGS